MTQLPSANPYSPGLWYNAYDVCLKFEKRSINSSSTQSGPSALVCARFLGYMILEAPTPIGRHNFSNEVLSCANDMTLKKLATCYIDHFIRCFRAAKCRTPAPSHHPSSPPFDNVQEFLKYLLEEAPQSHQTAKHKALIRDGYRCVLTGNCDVGYEEKVASVAEAIRNGAVPAYTRATHIIPEATNTVISSENANGAEHEYATSLWGILERFGNDFAPDELNGPKIHRLENIMTLESNKHEMFDHLQLWLEEMEQPNCYRPAAIRPTFLFGVPAHVTFVSTNDALPLPSPSYLRLHAACSRVAHLSGAGEYVEKVSRDLEETLVLASDGTSADILRHALLRTDTSVR